MKINGVQEAGTQPGATGMIQKMDSFSKNIQRQIANLQKKLQSLSENEDLSMEEKMKKRQEIQQEIANLNQQLRQHQIQQRNEKQTKQASAQDVTRDANHEKKSTKDKSLGLSQGSMQALISADSSLKRANMQGSIAAKLEGRTGVLETEIKLDGQRGGNTQKKEEELADIQQKAQEAVSSQIGILADASESMQEAVQKEQPSSENNIKTEEGNRGNEDGETEVSVKKLTEDYIPVDLYL